MVSSIIGAAASFVGWLSLEAIFSAPYVYGRDIGGEIGQVDGVLMSYWLYIHVTMVVASYAMIGMSFLLGLLWLWNYYKEFGTFSRLANKRVLAVDERAGFEVINVAGGAATMSVGATLASLFFLKRPAVATTATTAAVGESASTEFMRTIDACNVVVLQLAFWLLGVGIILGAVWADQSWGRPWGWDPKETFALVTWIVYLIVVHTRISVENKGWWTAVLSVIGFFVMLFNWVGVNFFLVGLHSYA
jgi:cytochrome c-type biogenesis protein CcsB